MAFCSLQSLYSCALLLVLPLFRAWCFGIIIDADTSIASVVDATSTESPHLTADSQSLYTLVKPQSTFDN